MRKFFAAFLCLLGLAVAADARFPRGGATTDSTAVTFTHVPIGGAGAIIGVQGLQSANLLIAKADQYNCYLSINGSMWTPLLKSNNVPVGYASLSSAGWPIGNGCDEGIPDPSNANTLWLGANGGVLLSVDQGANWTDTCYPHLAYGDGSSPGQTQSLKGFFNIIAVDPNNPNIVYMSTPQSGLIPTYNKGVTCGSAIAALGTGTAIGGGYGGHSIAFDTSGGTRTNLSSPPCPGSQTICTANVYVSTYGTGVFKSVDGGVNWALTTGTPTTHIGMRTDGHGNLFFLENTFSNALGTLKKYNGTTWSTPTGLPTLGVGLAIDANNCASAVTCRIIVALGGGVGSTGVARSDDGGTTWNVAQTITTTSADVTWIADFINAGFGQYSAGLALDNSGNAYVGGEGVFKYTPPASGSAVTFASFTNGIEESLSSSVSTSVATTGKVNLATWDLGCFTQLAMPYTSFPLTVNRGCYAPNAPQLVHMYNIDWATADPSFFIAIGDTQGGYGGGGPYINYSGTSTDGGANWSVLTGPPVVAAGIGGGGLKGGCIAAASSTNFLWAPTDGSAGSVPPYYTTNGGTTWTPISTLYTPNALTNGTTASGNATLNFASTTGITAGMKVYNDSAPATLQNETTVLSVTSTTVVLDKTAQGAGVANGARIVFSRGGWGFQYYNRSHVCASDRVTANTFYMYNWNIGTGDDTLYKCSSGGAVCTPQSVLTLGTDRSFNGLIKTVPDNAGHIFASNATTPFEGTGGMVKYSTDEGVNWNTVTGFTDVLSLGFGKAFAGHTYPAIVIVGFYNGVYGIWRSIDWDGAKTWEQIGPYPKNLAVSILDVDGDKVIPNVFYYTTNSGLFCSAPSTSYCNGGT